MPATWIIVLVVMAAGLIQGITGFGFGLFAMGIFVMVMPITDAVVIVGVLTLASSMLNLSSLRDDVDWREALPILVTALPATVLGIYLLRNLETGILRIGVAAMILAGCAATLWSPREAAIRRAFPWAHLAGSVGGLFGGALNMGGPPVVVYALLRRWNKATAKSTIAAYFCITGILRLGLLVATGVATRENLTLSFIALAPSLLAAYGGILVFRRLSTQMFRYATMALLLGLAAKVLLA